MSSTFLRHEIKALFISLFFAPFIFSIIKSTARDTKLKLSYSLDLEDKKFIFCFVMANAYVYTMIEHLRLKQKLFTKTKLEHKNEWTIWLLDRWFGTMRIESLPIVRFYFQTKNQNIFRINVSFGVVLMFEWYQLMSKRLKSITRIISIRWLVAMHLAIQTNNNLISELWISATFAIKAIPNKSFLRFLMAQHIQKSPNNIIIKWKSLNAPHSK